MTLSTSDPVRFGVEAGAAALVREWLRHSNRYSTRNPLPVYGSVNTAEKVPIQASELGNTAQITIRVSAFSLTGDAITSPTGIHNGTQNEGTTLYPRHDFAIAVINAHE